MKRRQVDGLCSAGPSLVEDGRRADRVGWLVQCLYSLKTVRDFCLPFLCALAAALAAGPVFALHKAAAAEFALGCSLLGDRGLGCLRWILRGAFRLPPAALGRASSPPWTVCASSWQDGFVRVLQGPLAEFAAAGAFCAAAVLAAECATSGVLSERSLVVDGDSSFESEDSNASSLLGRVCACLVMAFAVRSLRRTPLFLHSAVSLADALARFVASEAALRLSEGLFAALAGRARPSVERGCFALERPLLAAAVVALQTAQTALAARCSRRAALGLLRGGFNEEEDSGAERRLCVLVSGAGGDIGRSLCALLCRRGFVVVACCRDSREATLLRRAWPSAGASCRCVCAAEEERGGAQQAPSLEEEEEPFQHFCAACSLCVLVWDVTCVKHSEAARAKVLAFLERLKARLFAVVCAAGEWNCFRFQVRHRRGEHLLSHLI